MPLLDSRFDEHAVEIVEGDDVGQSAAIGGGDAADEVVGAVVDEDAVADIGQGERARGIGADEAADHDVAVGALHVDAVAAGCR